MISEKTLGKLSKFYKKNYKLLLILPFLMFLISLYSIYMTVSHEGNPIYRDISLKGGLSAILNVESDISQQQFEDDLFSQFSDNSFLVSEIFEEDKKVGFIVDTDLSEEDFLVYVENYFGVKFELDNNYSSNYISPTLSGAFFKQAVLILFVSLFFMSLVIFLYFREIVPSTAVILSVIFDLIVTIGILDFMKFPISIAGIGALLMLIGYSIDTDVLLTNRLIKEFGDEYFEKTFFAFKTGMLMTGTTLAASIGAIILTSSHVIYEITLILFIGLVVDFISTWIQNTGILLWWLENKKN